MTTASIAAELLLAQQAALSEETAWWIGRAEHDSALVSCWEAELAAQDEAHAAELKLLRSAIRGAREECEASTAHMATLAERKASDLEFANNARRESVIYEQEIEYLHSELQTLRGQTERRFGR